MISPSGLWRSSTTAMLVNGSEVSKSLRTSPASVVGGTVWAGSASSPTGMEQASPPTLGSCAAGRSSPMSTWVSGLG